MKQPKKFRHRMIKHLREWHRKLGIIAAFFLIFLSVTGVALNHIDLFSLVKHKIKATWLLNYYGIKPPKDVHFHVNNKLIITDELIWFDNKLLFNNERNAPIVSVGQFSHYIYLATATKLMLFNLQGELIDQLDETMGLPVPIDSVAKTQQSFIISSKQAMYQSDTDFISWQLLPANTISRNITGQLISPKKLAFKHNAEVPSALKINAIENYRSQFLSWEKVILDIHSGRILGLFGVLFMDFMALLLILLSISGVYIWLRYARNKR